MIFPNLNASIPPKVEDIRLLRVKRIPPLPQLRDSTQQRGSQSGEQGLGTKKQTESHQEHRQEEQESTNYAKITLNLEKLFQTYSMRKCSTQSDLYLMTLTTSTAWRRHYGVTTYKSLEQLTASPRDRKSTRLNSSH